MRDKNFRYHQERVKDLRRRFLYKNHVLNNKGRYELSDKEDHSSSQENNPVSLYWRYGFMSRKVVAENLIDNKTGHWQEYPKTKYYGSRGYYMKKTKTKSALKLEDDIITELTEEEYE